MIKGFIGNIPKAVRYIILLVLCLSIAAIIYVNFSDKEENSNSSAGGSFEAQGGSFEAHLNSDVIALLCDIEEKYRQPSEENIISRKEAEKVINDVVGKEFDYNFWMSSYTEVYLFEDDNRYIFLECYSQDKEYNKWPKYFSILDKNNNRFYMILDAETGFRYINSDFSYLYDVGGDMYEYTSAFVDKEKRKIICGFEWTKKSDDIVHIIYDGNGDAEMYAYYKSPMVYQDKFEKEVSRDEYLALMEKYDDYISQTYNYNFGNWGI